MRNFKTPLAGYLAFIGVIGSILQLLSHTQPELFCKYYMFVDAKALKACLGLYNRSVLYNWMVAKHLFFIYAVFLPYAAWHNWGRRENLPLLRIGCVAVAVILVGNIVMLWFSQRAGETGPIHLREWVTAVLAIAVVVVSWKQTPQATHKPEESQSSQASV